MRVPLRVYIAKDVYGTDDPTEIGKKFADYQTILQTGQEMKDAGYRIFASTGELGYFAGSEPWIVDGKLNVSQARKDFMDVNIELYNQDLTCYVDTLSLIHILCPALFLQKADI